MFLLLRINVSKPEAIYNYALAEKHTIYSSVSINARGDEKVA